MSKLRPAPVALVLTIASLAPLVAQDKPVFDVVSIKRNTSDALGSNGSSERMDGGFTLLNIPITTLIGRAYPSNMPIPVDLLTGLPEWAGVRGERYDIIAKSSLSRPATIEERQAMVRALLADRLKLVAHTESRSQGVFELVIARKDGRLGPNLKPSEIDCVAKLAADDAAGAPRWRPTPADIMGTGGPVPTCAFFSTSGHLEGDATMESLAFSLGLSVAMTTRDVRRVVDKTGLNGSYRLKMNFDSRVGRSDPDISSDQGTSIFAALQEQLGLKLDSTKIMRDTLVIDHIERPTEN